MSSKMVKKGYHRLSITSQ